MLFPHTRCTTKLWKIYCEKQEVFINMKATGIVRRIDDLGRVVIPKEIRRTLRIREGDPLHTSLTPFERFCYAMLEFSKRCIGK